MGKLQVWQCTRCIECNLLSDTECRHCHEAKSSLVRLLEISSKSPAGKELMEYQERFEKAKQHG